MVDTLSQEEVDALRAAVKSGEVLDKEAAPEAGGDQVKVASYDFRKPHLVSSDQMHSLQMLHESLGRDLQSTLFANLKTSVEIKLVAMDQVTYSEFVLSVANPTYLALLSTQPDSGNAALELSLSLAMTILDILYYLVNL